MFDLLTNPMTYILGFLTYCAVHNTVRNLRAYGAKIAADKVVADQIREQCDEYDRTGTLPGYSAEQIDKGFMKLYEANLKEELTWPSDDPLSKRFGPGAMSSNNFTLNINITPPKSPPADEDKPLPSGARELILD